MEEIKKQFLLISLANYNETVNNMSKFKLNDREINLFCDIMQQFAEKYHTEQLRIYDAVGQDEQLPPPNCSKCGRSGYSSGTPFCTDDFCNGGNLR